MVATVSETITQGLQCEQQIPAAFPGASASADRVQTDIQDTHDCRSKVTRSRRDRVDDVEIRQSGVNHREVWYCQ